MYSEHLKMVRMHIFVLINAWKISRKEQIELITVTVCVVFYFVFHRIVYIIFSLLQCIDYIIKL